MRMFNDAADWKKTGDRTLTFSYAYGGRRREESLEMRGQMLHMQLTRLSLMRETAWRFPDNGYSSREYISAFASLNWCRVHGVSPYDAAKVAFVGLQVVIYPVELGKLQETNFDQPSTGYTLKSDAGKLVYYWSDDGPEFYAELNLDHNSFDDLSADIRAGGIRSAKIDVIADLFGLPYGGIPGADEDYVILLEGDEPSRRGETKAWLQNVTLEWSPVLETKTGRLRDDLPKVETPIKKETPVNIEGLEPSMKDDRQESKPSGWSPFFRRPRRPRA